MATFKLNIARIRGCPPPAEVAEALDEFGLPETEEFGVLNHSAAGEAVWASLVGREACRTPRSATNDPMVALSSDRSGDFTRKASASPCCR